MRTINATILILLLVSSPTYAVTESIFTYMNSGDNAMWTRQFVGAAPTRTNATTGQTAKSRIVTSLPANIYSRSEVENLYYEVVVDFYYPNGNLHKTVPVAITRTVSLLAGTTDYKPSFAMSYTYSLNWPPVDGNPADVCEHCGELHCDVQHHDCPECGQNPCTCAPCEDCGKQPWQCDCEEEEEEEECTHCCSCTCDCEGGWTGVTCAGHASGKCPEGSGCSEWGEQYHCDCHKITGESDCCEHHKRDYVPPPNVNYDSIPEIDVPNMDGHGVAEPDITLPPGPGRPNIPQFSPPRQPAFTVPETEKHPLEYFERKEGEWPEFKYEEIFEDLKEKLEDKIPLGWLENFTGGGAGQSLTWKINFNVMNTRVGPWEWNISKMINDLAENQIFKILRLIMLFIVSVYAILLIIGVIFDAK